MGDLRFPVVYLGIACREAEGEFSNQMKPKTTTTTAVIDDMVLLALQREGKRLGFRSWGAYLRHILDLHILVNGIGFNDCRPTNIDKTP